MSSSSLTLQSGWTSEQNVVQVLKGDPQGVQAFIPKLFLISLTRCVNVVLEQKHARSMGVPEQGQTTSLLSNIEVERLHSKIIEHRNSGITGTFSSPL